MIVHFEESFLRDVRNIKSTAIKSRIGKVIDQLKREESPARMVKIKKMKGYHNAYRIRIGDYRIGFFMEKNEVVLSRCLHRKDIYKIFPLK